MLKYPVCAVTRAMGSEQTTGTDNCPEVNLEGFFQCNK